jgi:hypothetical protein
MLSVVRSVKKEKHAVIHVFQETMNVTNQKAVHVTDKIFKLI